MASILSRREFLAAAGGTAGSVLAGQALVPDRANGATPSTRGMSPLDVAAVEGPPAQSVEKALELLGGMGQFVKPGHRVILKPNMGFPNPPERGTTTSPEVVRKVAMLCLDAGAKQVLVLDHPVRRAELCLQRSGIQEACSGLSGVHVHALTGRKFYQRVDLPGNKILSELEIMKDVLEADLIVNLPTAKSHSATGVSLSLKNLMGVIWDRGHFHRNVDLDQAISVLNGVVRPQLTILDASRVLSDGGPGGPGKILPLRTIVAGVNPVSVDAFAVEMTEWYGRRFSARQVKHLAYSWQLGLGEIDTGKLNVHRASC